MAFFTIDNPIALFLALVVTVMFLKYFLGKTSIFQGGNASYLTLAMVGMGVLLIAYKPLLKMLAVGIPFIALVIIFLFAVGAIMFTMGMKEGSIWSALKAVGPLKVGVIIAFVCIAAYAGSTVFGEKMLKEPSVSFADPMIPPEEQTEIDFSPLFTKAALGMIFIVIILGLAFLFVNFS